MKITDKIILNKKIASEKEKTKATASKTSQNYADVKYSQIAFGAIVGIKNKKIDIETEKHKILRQINAVLETNTSETDEEDYLLAQLQKSIQWLHNKQKRIDELIKTLENIENDSRWNIQQKIDIANQLKKEYTNLVNAKKPKLTPPKKSPLAEKTDYSLYNKFKSAISENDFNLENIYRTHYSSLSEITSVNELSKKYPHIKIPKRPEQVITEKFVSSLTRDFYEKLDELYENKDKEGVAKHFQSVLQEQLTSIARATNIDKQTLSDKLSLPIMQAVASKYADIVKNDKFSSIPQFRKNKASLFSENDLKLLSVDYNKFVLTVVREQYLQGKKLNNILYEENGIKIPIGTLKENEYKFEKVSDKDRRIIELAKELNIAQRNYKFYEKHDFQNRLEFYSNSQIAQNTDIYEKIIEFYTCNYDEQDIKPMIQFLELLDDISDGKKSDEEVIKIIKKENIFPIGTLQQNEVKNKEIEAKLKEEQQKIFELKNLKSKFDDTINILYLHNLNNIALTCSKYRPESLDKSAVESANFIIKTIQALYDESNYEITNKTKLQSTILRYDTYNNYKKNHSDSPIFKDAVIFANTAPKDLYIDKIGQYITNAEIIENYPESGEYYKNPTLLNKIVEKSNNSKEAILKLCKLDDYNSLQTIEKSYISSILTLFDIKDPIEKTIIRHLIENDYTNIDTDIDLPMNDSNDTRKVVFAKTAKQEILQKYKFPTCIEYLAGFEDSMSHLSSEKGNSGIKLTGRNNEKQKYKMEAKLAGHDDRLFSSKNDFYFDVFSPIGLH